MQGKKTRKPYVNPRARLRNDVQRARLEFSLAIEDFARGGPAEMPRTLKDAFEIVNSAVREDMRPFRDFRAFWQWRNNVGNAAKIRSARNEWAQFGANIAELFDSSARDEGVRLTTEERREFCGSATHVDPALSAEANKSEGLRSLGNKIDLDEDRAFVARTVQTLRAAIARDKSGKALDTVLRDYARLLGRPPGPNVQDGE